MAKPNNTSKFFGSDILMPPRPGVMATFPSGCNINGSSKQDDNFSAANNFHSDTLNQDCGYSESTFPAIVSKSGSAMVAGVVALMLQANPELGWRDVKHILATTAKDVDTDFTATPLNDVNYVGWVTNFAGFDHHAWYGFGAVDAAAAVAAAKDHINLQPEMTTAFNKTTDFDQSISDFTNPIQPHIDSIIESGDGLIEHVRVRIQFNHSQPNQLGFRLVSPSGTTATLLAPFSQKGGLGTPLITQSSEFASNAFYGEGKAGAWQLLVTDHVTGETGAIRNFGISFMYR